jgi:DNA (cytosine-5)-methyltransferase 1
LTSLQVLVVSGFSLGLQMAGGFETVAMCELPDNQAVLRKHWPDVQYYGDIKELTYERLQADGIVSDTNINNKRTGKGHQQQARNPSGKRTGYSSDPCRQTSAQAPKRIDIITGGFPCQPFSHAGQRRGTEDDRHLWPEMLRVISEVRPTWVIGENVAGIVSMELSTLSSQVESKTLTRHPESDYVAHISSREANMLLNGICEDLEQIGYEVQPLVIPACGVDAKHRRDRVWIIAHAGSKRINRERGDLYSTGQDINRTDELNSSTPDVSNTDQQGLEKREVFRPGAGQARSAPQGENIALDDRTQDGRFRPVEPELCGVADGISQKLDGDINEWPDEWPGVPKVANNIPNRVDRLRGLGNAVVPQVVAELGRAIMEQHK